MTFDNQKNDALIPDRYPQGDLFICDVADAVLKDITPQMEHPFYSLSKRPETTIRRYEHDGNWIEIIPSVKGLATIYDKDILIYCISQLIAKKNNGESLSRKVRVSARDLLIFSNRGTAGKDYQALCEALDRLDGTRIRTNIRRENEEEFNAFGLIDSASVARKFGLDGRLLWCEITLSEWVFEAVSRQEVLTLHRDYFRLRKPLERRIYEIARKHCGRQKRWSVSLSLIHKKSGSKSPLKHFRYLIKELVCSDHLPDYRVTYEESTDKVTFYNRNDMVSLPSPQDNSQTEQLPDLQIETYAKAKQVAPSYDIHFLENEWRQFWEDSGKPEIYNPDMAFIKFCARRYERKPNP